MPSKKEAITVTLSGAAIYSVIEIIWRGFTHWTMAIAGGVSFLFIHIVNIRTERKSLFKKCAAGSGIITTIEFVTGVLVNKVFSLNVWDYSNRPFNIMGQICPLYSILWFFLTIPAVFLSGFINEKFKIRRKEKSRAKAQTAI